MIKLGDKVRDTITNYSGVVIAETRWLHGCTRVGVQAEELHEGKLIEPEWFDVNRVELVTAAEGEAPRPHDPNPGGPQKDPVGRRSGESR